MEIAFEKIIKDMDFEKYYSNIQDRRVVIFGADKDGERLAKVLEEKGLLIYAFIDEKTLEDSCNHPAIKILDLNILQNAREEFYVFVSGDYREEIEKFLNANNYEEIKDYLYIMHKPTVIENDYEYVDIYGNRIFGPKGMQLKFIGYNSTVKLNSKLKADVNICCNGSKIIIDENCSIGNDISIICTENSSIKISEGCEIGESVSINCKKESTVHIENNCKILHKTLVNCSENSNVKLKAGCKIRDRSLIGCIEASLLEIGEKSSFDVNSIFYANKGGHVSIGEKCTAGYNLVCHSCFGGIVKLGDDCMLSVGVVINSNDGHAIFNLNTRQQINGNKSVKIGNHVWLGIKSTILSNADIGDGSIIGASSLVNKKFPNNCIVTGNPARITKKDIAWDREKNDIDQIDTSLYWNATIE